MQVICDSGDYIKPVFYHLQFGLKLLVDPYSAFYHFQTKEGKMWLQGSNCSRLWGENHDLSTQSKYLWDT